MIKSKVKISLSIKLVATISLLIIVTSLVITKFFLSKQSMLYTKTLELQSRTLVQNLANNSELGVVIFNRELIQSQLKGMLEDHNVLISAILTPKMGVLGIEKRESMDLRVLSNALSKSNLKVSDKVESSMHMIPQLTFPALYLTAPIYTDETDALDEEEMLFFEKFGENRKGKLIGYAALVVSTESIESAILKTKQMSSIITGAVILLGIVAGFLLTRVIIKPVRDLVQGTESLSRGEFSIQVDVHSKDEIGVLTESFNTMVLKMKDQQDQLVEYNRTLEDKVRVRTAELATEKEKSESLLLNILPNSIANRLKQGERTIADKFSEVTVLFSDIVGFTTLSSKVSPTELVEMLNAVVREFDLMTQEFGLEKIKTIGDAYMAVAGLPEPCDDHAVKVAKMALKMQKFIHHFQTQSRHAIQIRVGINTGPAVAGVIGIKKFVYDLWGDAVNIASRMESSGLAGGIQISESTYEKIKGKFIIEERGIIDVKGKGQMKTYLLKGEKE